MCKTASKFWNSVRCDMATLIWVNICPDNELLTVPRHYLNQCWLIISKVLRYSCEDIIIRKSENTNQQSKIENSILKSQPGVKELNSCKQNGHHMDRSTGIRHLLFRALSYIKSVWLCYSALNFHTRGPKSYAQHVIYQNTETVYENVKSNEHIAHFNDTHLRLISIWWQFSD